ncbi:MAG: tRNA(Met) cytidine acetyltransferase [Glaciecola sp.]
MTGKLLIDWLNQRKKVNSHRQLVVISGQFDWCAAQAETILDYETSRTLLVSRRAIGEYLPRTNSTKADYAIKAGTNNSRSTIHSDLTQYKQQLGTEFDVLVYDAFDGIKPSALYALEGTIGRGGLLLLLCPKLTDWPEYEATSPGIAFSSFGKHTSSLFVRRMRNMICRQTSTAFLSENKQYLPLDVYEKTASDNLISLKTNNFRGSKLSADAARSISNLTHEQQQALNNLLEVFADEKISTSRIGLIRAKRGRGKSTILGRLAAELIAICPEQAIYITAPHLNNCERAQTEFKAAIKFINTHYKEQQPLSSAQLRLIFVAPDQLLNLDKNSILIIDEAAAISPRIILNVCKYFNKLIMATTVAGYEGSGLGFNLKVLPKLKELNISFTLVELSKAIRWYPNDNLEALFESTFSPLARSFTAVEPAFHTNKINFNNIEFKLVEKSELIEDEETLKTIFGLLVQSHYQTTPDDLMRILDAPDHHIAILTKKTEPNSPVSSQNIISVAVIVNESLANADVKEDLIEDIISSLRRVNGHLVAQNLATTLYDKWFLHSTNWRVVRIAVHSKQRQKGIGSAMLSHIEALAKKQHVDYISTSFGFTNELFSFWKSQHYKLIKIGARRDTSSGEHSSIWVLPLSDEAAWQFYSYAEVILNDMDFLINVILKNENDEHWWLNLKTLLNDAESALALLNRNHDKPIPPSAKHQFTEEQSLHEARYTHYSRLTQFIQGKRSYANAAASIYYYFKHQEKELILLNEIQQKHHSKAQKSVLVEQVKLRVNEYIILEDKRKKLLI